MQLFKLNIQIDLQKPGAGGGGAEKREVEKIPPEGLWIKYI